MIRYFKKCSEIIAAVKKKYGFWSFTESNCRPSLRCVFPRSVSICLAGVESVPVKLTLRRHIKTSIAETGT